MDISTYIFFFFLDNICTLNVETNKHINNVKFFKEENDNSGKITSIHFLNC